MFRIDNSTAISALPTVPAPGTPGFFTRGNVTTALAPTIVDDWWLNTIQEEIVAVVQGAGITLDKTNRTQLLAAIQAIAIASSPNLSGYLPLSGGTLYKTGTDTPLIIHGDGMARIQFQATGLGTWRAGVHSAGQFALYQDTPAQVRLSIDVNGLVNIPQNLSVNGTANIIGQASLGSANVAGNGTLGSLTVQGAATVAGLGTFGSLTVNGTTTINGTENVNGSANVQGNIQVFGTSTLGTTNIYGVTTISLNSDDVTSLLRLYNPNGGWAYMHFLSGGYDWAVGCTPGSSDGSFHISDQRQAPANRPRLMIHPNGDTQISGDTYIGGAGIISGSGINYVGVPTGGIASRFAFTWNSALEVWADGGYLFAIPASVSDERSKRDIAPSTTDALACLQAIELFSYDRLDLLDPEKVYRHDYVGFSAQQMREAIPEAVIETNLPDDVAEPRLGIDLMPVAAYTVRAVQQLAERVEALERRKD